MTLPPKIELALGYLGGTEANRIREYIEELESALSECRASNTSLNETLGEARRQLVETRQKLDQVTTALNKSQWRLAYRG